MCEFVSWIEKGRGKTKKVLFLTCSLIDSKKGQKLLKDISQEDLIGHGAIRRFFGLEQDEGMNKECTDFSSPNNFPATVVKAIKSGEMRGLATSMDLLSASAWAEFQKIRQSAWAEYEKIEQPALAEFQKNRQSAWDLFAIPTNRNPAWRD